MATAATPPEDNLRTYILTELRRIVRNLEDGTKGVDENVLDYALYRLEQVIVLALRSVPRSMA